MQAAGKGPLTNDRTSAFAFLQRLLCCLNFVPFIPLAVVVVLLLVTLNAPADDFLPFSTSPPIIARSPSPVAPRIVSLAPVISEWIAEILGEKETLAELVGVSEYSQYPSYLQKIKTIGPYPQIQVEAILALHPTLVIASDEYNRPEQIEKLKLLHLPVVQLKAERFLKMEAWIRDLGHALGQDHKAESAAQLWRQKLEKLHSAVSLRASLKAAKERKAKRILIEIQDEPLITVGHESFLTDAFREIGEENIFAGLPQAYPKVSREAVVKENPEKIYILDLTHEGNKKALQTWKKFPDLIAVKNGSIQVISGDDFARCSLPLLIALEKLR